MFLPLNLILLVFATCVNCQIKIKDHGVLPVRQGDVGMVFYAVIQNRSGNKYLLDVKMEKCTENISDRDKYDDIELIGGHMGFLEEWSKKKVTLIYPNMYLYNRKGVCEIAIVLTNARRYTRTLKVKIPYGSRVGDEHTPKEMKDLYKSKTPKKCATPDLDPLEKCLPVDCTMKYLGTRNFFNEKFRRCQDVVSCISDSEDGIPDVTYLPTSNRCKSTEDCMREDELGKLLEGRGPNCTDQFSDFRMLNVRCNHGVVDNLTGMCICNPGWTSGDNDPDKYVPSLSVYHMCNIEVDSWSEANKKKIRNTILAFMILAVLIAMLVLLCTFCLYGLYTYMRSLEEDASPRKVDDDDAYCSDMLSEKCY